MTVQSASAILSIIVVLVIVVVFLHILRHSGEGADFGPVQTKAGKIRKALFLLMVLIGIPFSAWLLRAMPYAIAPGPKQIVNVTGHQWYWDMDRDEVVAGEPVEFRVTAGDVNHGFGLYDEDGRMVAQTQAMPGYVNRLVHVFGKPGTYKIMCLEYCGVAHHAMISELTVKGAQESNG